MLPVFDSIFHLGFLIFYSSKFSNAPTSCINPEKFIGERVALVMDN